MTNQLPKHFELGSNLVLPMAPIGRHSPARFSYSLYWATIALFILAAAARILWLGEYPGGLNQDEASSGYDAWALLSEGIDRHGLSWPVHFIAWGSGQNALYAYLSMPFITLGGPSVANLRLAAACLGIMGLWIFWRLGRRQDQQLAFWALLVIATSPWHLMASRWALESNAAPPVALLAVYCLTKAKADLRWLVGGSAVLASAVYAYGTAYFFAPLFLLCAWIIVARQRSIPFTWLLISALAAFFVALPIMAFILNNSFGSGHLAWGPITIPKYPSEARYSGMFLPLAENGWSQIPKNAIEVFRMLLGARDDGLPWNAAPHWGPQLWVLTPFLMLGAGYALRARNLTDELMLAWLVCALLTACCTSANINRINFIWLPSLWLSARGFWLVSGFTLWNKIAQFSLFAVGTFFTLYYFNSWQERITENFFPGLGESLTAIAAEAPADAPITVTQHSVYTNSLYFLRPSPKEYVATAIIPDPTSPFANVEGFGRVTFGINADRIVNRNYWVAHKSELHQFSPLDFNIKTFGFYAAITRKGQADRVCYRPLDLSGFSGKQDHGTLSVNNEVGAYYGGLPIADQSFYSGLGVHGDSQWSMELNPADEILEIGMGLSSSSGCSDGMTFKILLDGKPVFNSGHMRPGDIQFTKVPISAASKLTLATEAGYHNRCDHGLWLAPTIKRCAP